MRRSYFVTTDKDAEGNWVAWAAIHDDASRAPATGGGTAIAEEEAIRIAIGSARSALQRLTLPPGPREERTTDRPPPPPPPKSKSAGKPAASAGKPAASAGKPAAAKKKTKKKK
jgi:hypothetical protein